MQITLVEDNEVIYRCIFYETSDGVKTYKIQNGQVRVSSQAFRDSSLAPSVDRACFCQSDPRYSQKDSKDGVVSFICGEVRLIDSVTQKNQKGEILTTYKIDVLHRPEDHNFAHSQIEPSPAYKKTSHFKKLQERLAFLANKRDWEVLPYDARNLV